MHCERAFAFSSDDEDVDVPHAGHGAHVGGKGLEAIGGAMVFPNHSIISGQHKSSTQDPLRDSNHFLSKEDCVLFGDHVDWGGEQWGASQLW